MLLSTGDTDSNYYEDIFHIIVSLSVFSAFFLAKDMTNFIIT